VWRHIPQAPILPWHSQTATWTGREMLVWGNRGGSAEPVGSAAYDPVEDRWRELPEAPLGRLESTGSAWTGSELLVWGSRALDEPLGQVEVAAYDPATDTWRKVASPPLSGPRFYLSAQWTGERLVLFGGQEWPNYSEESRPGPFCTADPVPYHDEAFAIDPATDSRQRLPDRPEVLRRATARSCGELWPTTAGWSMTAAFCCRSRGMRRARPAVASRTAGVAAFLRRREPPRESRRAGADPADRSRPRTAARSGARRLPCERRSRLVGKVAPPSPYSDTPDGSATVTLTYTVEATSR